MNDISVGIKKVLFVFLLLFIVVISYVAYFEVYVAPKIVNNTDNKRLWAKRNEVLRGTIYDRNKNALTKSSRVNTLTQKREYTGGAVFAHVLGYVNPSYGITGLESKYDQYLMGANDMSIVQYLKEFIANKGSVKKEDKKGNDLITTLDSDVQKQAYNLLSNTGQKGAVVALNPKTGEILAMVSAPSFNPNDSELTAQWKSISTDKSRPLLNRAVSGLYPPGSTFKTVTAISALENISGVMNQTFNDTGGIRFNSKYALNNFGGEVLGSINLKQAYIHSSNQIFGTLGLTLGNNKLKKTAEDFYFNKDIPSDGIVIDKSRFPTYDSSEPGNIAQSAIGQSQDLATPMQMALVASTIANDGVMMKPYLVNSVISSTGNTIMTYKPESIGNVTTPEIAATMKEFMRGVVTDGTGGNADISGLNVCGKTGTADHQDTSNARPHSWFIGFAPMENPKIAVAVIVEDGGQGGIQAAKIAAGVIKTSLSK
ncbi:penicillin-binding protein A [Clostridium pasteurianum DSM 525 = ATCC 6013]|uniref:Penicillin-binding protein A n=1 Tax=Clostridium pasteurianum DSM 525 = ATCC 6013 TaxID=1262449 RepID=A0A0H3J5W7_CLOPA|nr:penicillin-binding transpeptidase domain-containing protein [Clostridium pasteurianum]AJA48844.1 penicillin-binding protein A [Clostridium pasteurianum DSM 525 = ATCC 6013]AJA52832.1 penicillin-binding protein A [Clostridium pasteurianum DSM 525 = ATCC 6013]AOZ76056.1 penicillin-binding protein [Clostridium pasteurianum DSM 525 = ATCC 6013]AOZ79852.1 penicillin-binding protein [Clostridium pasteurianum]ELP60140.1 Penicillin-binding protein [Clostridium pasteurianum DSM 525 = ATCC 6013]